MDLKTKYLGMEINSPIVVGASNLSMNTDILSQLEEAGAGAIVYKSLFEEQIQMENFKNWEDMAEYADRNAEMTTLFPDESLYDQGPEQFIHGIKKAREAVDIPLIASLNCINDDTWYEYAKKLEEIGVNGLELNFYHTPKEFDLDGNAILMEQIDVLKGVKSKVKIPVSVKLSPFYTNPLYAIKELEHAGANGFVLFNRLFQPDIDIDQEKLVHKYQSSHENENCLSLRYAGLLHGNLDSDIISARGIHTSTDIIKMLLAGADSIQMVTTLYKNGPSYISKMLGEMQDWMSKKGYSSLNDFRGKMSRKNMKDDPYAYRRGQYVDAIMKIDKFFKKVQR